MGYDREEHRQGICGVGVAVTDVDGSVAAISVPMPAARFDEDEDAVVAALLRIRDEIQVALAAAEAPPALGAGRSLSGEATHRGGAAGEVAVARRGAWPWPASRAGALGFTPAG